MKQLTFLFLFSFLFNCLSGQELFQVNGESLELKTDLEGKLDLLILNQKTNDRFFVKDENDNVFELLNTKDKDGNYQQEYKVVLRNLIKNPEISIDDIGYGRYSLRHFIKAYNSGGDSLYAYTQGKAQTQTRLGFFGGLTNHPFVTNPENSISPFFGAELEILGKKNMTRHAGYFSILHALENSDFEYSNTELALGYRYRFLLKSNFNIYINLKFAHYTFAKITRSIENMPEETVSESAFDAPFAFGLGADLRLKENSYITLLYDSLFALFLDNESNFPMDIALGYKFNL